MNKFILLILVFSCSIFASQKNKTFIKGSDTSIKNPLNLRDPFKRQRLKSRKGKKTYGGFLKNNKYSNRTNLEGFKVEQIRVVGIFLGKERRAIARVLTSEDGKLSQSTYLIKEGMKIGENDAEVRAIVPGGIVLVEKIINVYDQEEYIETVIPVSTE